MEISKRKRSNAFFKEDDIVINEEYNSIINNMTNFNINSNSELYQLNLKINDLEKAEKLTP